MSELALAALVGMAGAVGAAARFLVVEWMARWRRGMFPLATFGINIGGAFALGVITTAFAAPGQFPVRLALGVGFLGGYTTFSTLTYETLSLARRGDRLYAWVNLGGSLVAGMLAALLGMALGQRLG